MDDWKERLGRSMLLNRFQTDDDWFEYKKEKDYSDLKIKNLMIEHPEDNEDDDEHEVNEDGQKVLKVKGESVWSKSQTQTNNQTATGKSIDPMKS